jgi:hypothetical protein
MQILDLRDLRISVRRLFKGVNCRASVLAISQRAAADIEGHSGAAEYGQPEQLRVSSALAGQRRQKFLERRLARELGFVPRLEAVLVKFDAEMLGSPVNAPSPCRSRSATADNDNKIAQRNADPRLSLANG